MLGELNFPRKFIGWIMRCITTTSYTLVVNGPPALPFKAAKGLRQGDPLSPYLFAIGMEYFTRAMNELGRSGNCSFHTRCNKLNITHILFADDMLMFGKGNVKTVKQLSQTFDHFSQVSRLIANCGKSNVYLAGVDMGTKRLILIELNMIEGVLPFRYLGVPLHSKKLSFVDCRSLVEKITSKLGHWSTKFLSYGGRLELIRSVVAGISNFWAHIFILP